LKLFVMLMLLQSLPVNCKAHPDEKGIETNWDDVLSPHAEELQSTSRRKGNWNCTCRPGTPARLCDCKAHPDEKGIETGPTYFELYPHLALQSTSRRKGNWNSSTKLATWRLAKSLQSTSRRKGNWN